MTNITQQKEERDRKKQCVKVWLASCKKLQQGTPAQYRTTFSQTMPTGQMPSGMTGVLMPQGMTGVLASERGQNLPQPALFGENILQGNFDINRELERLLLKVENLLIWSNYRLLQDKH